MIFINLYIIIKIMPKKLTNNEAIKRLSLNNPNVFLIDQYYSSEEKSQFKCLICFHEWKANAKGVINGNNGCPECGKLKAKNTIKYNITTEKFQNKLNIKFPNKFTILNDYINHNKNIEVKCNTCNHIWISKPTYLIKGYGCIRCGNIEKGKKHRKSHKEFSEEIKIIYGDKISLLENYKKSKDRIKVKCNKCNHEWNPISHRLLYRGCPKCNFSKGELLISNILNELKVNFKEQYIFEDLKTDKNSLVRFDFVIFDNFNKIRYIIEYDGLQHFKEIKKWGGKKKLLRQQEIDKIKDNYCKNNNISIIRIPYTDFKKIDKKYIEKLWTQNKL